MARSTIQNIQHVLGSLPLNHRGKILTDWPTQGYPYIKRQGAGGGAGIRLSYVL